MIGNRRPLLLLLALCGWLVAGATDTQLRAADGRRDAVLAVESLGGRVYAQYCPRLSGAYREGPIAGGIISPTVRIIEHSPRKPHLLNAGQVVTVDLTNRKLIDADVSKLREFPNLRALSLADTSTSNAGLVHVGQLKNLEFLNMMRCQVSNRGLAHLQALNSLKYLYLSSPQVTDSGLAHLGKLAELRGLCIDLNVLTDDGLAPLKSLKKLRVLWLSGAVDDTDIDPLQGLGTVKAIILSGTQVTPEGARRLQAALPDCVILPNVDPRRLPVQENRQPWRPPERVPGWPARGS